jgi:hypothetical protein
LLCGSNKACKGREKKNERMDCLHKND